MIIGDIIRRNAALHGDREALVSSETRLTFAEFLGRALRAAAMLYARGVRRQDRVAVLAQNTHQYLEVYGAGETAGFITVGINTRLAAAEIERVLLDCDPSAIVFDAQYAAKIEAVLPTLEGMRALICLGVPVPVWAEDYETAIAHASTNPLPIVAREDDTAYLIYTSGTTGAPKGVMLDHRGQIETAREKSAAGAVQLNHKILIVMPLFHIGAKCLQLGYHWGGACIVLHRAFDPQHVLEAVQRERITALQLAPVMLQALLDVPNFADYDLSSLVTLHYSAAPIPTPLLKRALAIFGPILIQSYGPTETGPLGTVLQKSQHPLNGSKDDVRRLASAGQPSSQCEVKIVDDAGEEVARGAVGEIIIRSLSNMKGYWNNPEQTAVTLRDGWVYTGDVGYMDEKCFLFLTDRKKDMIISGGENIYSREVEEALHSHAAIAEAAVIGVPDARWGEAVKAFVMPHAGSAVTVEALDTHCKACIAGYKCPKTIELVSSLPRLPSGKVDKKKLREPFWKDAPRNI